MACFTVPAAEAIITTVATKVIKKNENECEHENAAETKLRFSDKLKWLNNMLWGGSALLAFEHLWNGELSPVFPFLTAASDPVSTSEMLREMATVGTGMAAMVTGAWAVMVMVTNRITKRARSVDTSSEAVG